MRFVYELYRGFMAVEKAFHRDFQRDAILGGSLVVISGVTSPLICIVRLYDLLERQRSGVLGFLQWF